MFVRSYVKARTWIVNDFGKNIQAFLCCQFDANNNTPPTVTLLPIPRHLLTR